jgi:hypothetical protein
MPLPEEIIKKIKNLLSQNKHDDILNYLKQNLESGGITPQDVYDWVKNNVLGKKPGQPYVVNECTINLLGVVVSKLPDNKEIIAGQFYFLAAQRGSAWGCRNYATSALLGTGGVKKSKKTALKYAEQAVKLTENTDEKDQHKVIYAKILKANGDYSLSFTVITSFLAAKKQDNLKDALGFCKELIDKFLTDFQKGNFDKEHLQARLLALQSVISCPGNHQELLDIRNKACLLAGKYYEFLNDNSKAWLAYCQIKNTNCKIKDTNFLFYQDVVIARKKLLKSFITNKFKELIASIPVGNMAPNENANPEPAPQKKTEDTILLPNGIRVLLNFSKSWNKDFHFLHSVNEAALAEHYNKRLGSIETMIKGKEEEITLVGEAIEKKLGEPNEVKSRSSLEAELEQLKDIAIEIKARYQKYSADSRRTLRRHRTETRFFDPNHLKKQEVLEKLRDLTFGIIEQRFSLENSALSPLNLVGISSRMLITAERVFQEATIILSGESGVVLGISRERGNSWEKFERSGTNWFGPVERYQVANTEIKAEHRTSPKRQRLGDSYMPQHGKYSGDIYPFLSKLASNSNNNEKLIAKYLIRFSRTHQAVTLGELQDFYQSADENDVNKFNQIAFLIMEKEQGQWHSATDERYQLGMSVAQARALKMLEAGFLSLDEVFNNDAPFGVYSHTGIIDSPKNVAKACQRIDELYARFVLSQSQNDSMRFFKSQIKEQEKRTPILTRQQAHQDLHYVYGGETDSDGEGYDTDLGM